MALVDKNAAIYVKDSEANEKLIKQAIDLAGDENLQTRLKQNIQELARPNATVAIVDEIEKLITV
jgi:UDP-N-acetylglucosamine--N-acetylmuramyl-(pentapeptide) pyrophosphoryl-undecaprenol N-acetylglucosamine transferase